VIQAGPEHGPVAAPVGEGLVVQQIEQCLCAWKIIQGHEHGGRQ